MEQVYEVLNMMLPRFFRLLPGETPSLPAAAKPVRWLPGFYCVPGRIPMSSVGDASRGVYAMDAASGLVVQALMERAHTSETLETVLDLCCCPGSKFQLISEMMTALSKGGGGIAVGVDNSIRRLELCRALLQKTMQFTAKSGQGDQSCRQVLFHCDGTNFDVHSPASMGTLFFDSSVMEKELAERDGTGRKRINKSAKGREMKRLRLISQVVEATTLFDRVLVDAECSHTGSYRHMRFVAHHTGDVDETAAQLKPNAADSFRNEARIATLGELQRNLAHKGFSLLKPGSGRMIYSTCCLDPSQNEDVVQWLLDTEPTCRVVLLEEKAISPPHPMSSPSTLSNDERDLCASLLQMADAELVAFHGTLTPAQAVHLSDQVCVYVAEQEEGPLKSGRFKGTFMLTRSGGTSGMFFAIFSKSGA